MAKHGLGRGLGALIRDGVTPEQVKPEPGAAPGVQGIPVAGIRENPWQPRRRFDEEALAELTESVRKRGVLQPLLVRAVEGGYELIAGERRLRAARKAGLADVPAIVMDVPDEDAAELALIENLQREDLDPIEEAEGYRMLVERFGLTQELIAQRVGKARASVANALRLLDLPDAVKQLLSIGNLSVGHAKVLLGLEIGEEQNLVARRIVEQGLSVRDAERLIRKLKQTPRKPRTARTDIPASHLNDLSERLHAHFGTAVRVIPCKTYANGKKAKGAIEIDYYSGEDLDRILDILGITEDM
jgi:ParB family chromosome partitioning protein